jgi:hypothetical protein
LVSRVDCLGPVESVVSKHITDFVVVAIKYRFCWL